MAITQMAKVMIITHRSQASELLEALQSEGIYQILNAQEAIVSKDFPELAAEAERPRDIEGLLTRLSRSIAFLKNYAEPPKGLTSILSPRTVVDQQAYDNVIDKSAEILKTTDQCEQIQAEIEKAKAEIENLSTTLQLLEPWAALETPVEQIGRLRSCSERLPGVGRHELVNRQQRPHG